MIKPGEIQQKANADGVRDQQIEKDYMLSWVLFGISKHEQLCKAIVFKGGTVLKKVYFENYSDRKTKQRARILTDCIHS